MATRSSAHHAERRQRTEHRLPDNLTGRDPQFIERLMPALDAMLRYFDAEIEGFDRLPAQGPMLIIANHSGGIYMPDFWAFLRRWVRERGADQPLYSLGFDFIYSMPGIRSIARRLGTVRACHANAEVLLANGASVLVYPGGDADDYRPWTERHRVDLHGRMGFVRLALRQQVPIVPMVSHGSHDVIVVVSRGDALARRLHLDRLRINVLPFVLAPPWGIVPILPTFPLPAKVMVRVCEPFDWSHFGPEAADNPAIVRCCYEEILGRMQANLDELVATQPHPILRRLLDPLGRGSRERHARP